MSLARSLQELHGLDLDGNQRIQDWSTRGCVLPEIPRLQPMRVLDLESGPYNHGSLFARSCDGRIDHIPSSFDWCPNPPFPDLETLQLEGNSDTGSCAEPHSFASLVLSRGAYNHIGGDHETTGEAAGVESCYLHDSILVWNIPQEKHSELTFNVSRVRLR